MVNVHYHAPELCHDLSQRTNGAHVTEPESPIRRLSHAIAALVHIHTARIALQQQVIVRLFLLPAHVAGTFWTRCSDGFHPLG